MNRHGYLIATDYMPADGVTDVSDALQSLIDANPNRTIFFPDGKYLLSKPVCTPAHPEKSVDLHLSAFACLRAADTWCSPEAMIRLGGKEPANDIYTPGSNYGLTGGIIDGCGQAVAISIDGGRETAIRNVSIKNAFIGIHIKHGANSGSSDADISGVNITGNGSVDSIGVLIEGYDNNVKYRRIDADVAGALKGDGDVTENPELSKLFVKVSANEKLKVEFSPLKDENVPLLLTISEESRRMEEMMKLYAMSGMGMMGDFPTEATLTVNTKSPLIAKLADMDGEKQEKTATYLYQLALLSQRKLTAEELQSFLSNSYSVLDML